VSTHLQLNIYIYIISNVYIDALYHPDSMVTMDTGGCDVTALYQYTGHP